MPTDTDFANDLNLDASDTQQIVNRLRACVHFLTKIDTRMTNIDSIFQPGSPPIHPDVKTQITSVVSLSESIFGRARRLNELPVSGGGLGDGGE